MGGQMDGWMDEWIDGCMDGPKQTQAMREAESWRVNSDHYQMHVIWNKKQQSENSWDDSEATLYVYWN